MTYQYRNKDGEMLGCDGVWLDKDDCSSLCYTGIWKDGKIVAIVFTTEEEDDEAFNDSIDRLYKNADEIIEWLNRKP